MSGKFIAALLGNRKQESINQSDAGCRRTETCSRVSRLCAVFLFYASLHFSLLAQTPAVLWTTNIAAQLFGVDTQTNVYAFGAGKIFILDAAGRVQQTNIVGIAEGQGTRMAQLDPSSGNYFYAGIHPGDICSLGVNYTNSACFLAKFSSAGNLIWSVDFGPIGCLRNIGITDIRIDSAGTIYVGYDWNVSTTSHVPTAAAFDASGSNIWSSTLPRSTFTTALGGVRFGRVTPTGGFALVFDAVFPGKVTRSQFDSNGTATVVGSFTENSAWARQLERPIENSLAEFFESEDFQLVKRSSTGPPGV